MLITPGRFTMKVIVLPFILVCFLQNTSSTLQAQDYHLIWSDEFNYEGYPDSIKWRFEEGFVRNKEAQYYTTRRLDNARVKNGNLILEARKEGFKSGEYTSASITTLNKQQFLYGRIEVRAKLPVGKGTWPAIWLLGTNINEVKWPYCGEIDIMENVGYDSLKIHGNIHTKAYHHSINTNKGNAILVENPWENYHVYAIEWHPDRIDFYCDTTKYFTFENDFKGDDETWPFNKPQYLLLNLAIGGSWGGQQGIDDSHFPHKFYIDYVRYYSITSKNEN
jgi:beta-glucanase (GH16 family)